MKFKVEKMKQKQIYIVIFAIGLFLALTGATLMFFGIFPLPLRITIGIIGLGLISLATPISRVKQS